MMGLGICMLIKCHRGFCRAAKIELDNGGVRWVSRYYPTVLWLFPVE